MVLLHDLYSQIKTINKDANFNVRYQSEYPTTCFVGLNTYDIFLTSVANEIFVEKNKKLSYCFSEDGQPVKKFILDLDFKLKENVYAIHADENNRILNDKTVSIILEKTSKILRSMYVGIDDFEVFVSIKPNIKYITDKDGEYVKDGLHLAIPELLLTSEALLFYRDRLIHSLFRAEEAYFSAFAEFADQIVDKGVMMGIGWMMYGNGKYGNDPYLINYSYKLGDLSTQIPGPKSDKEHYPFVKRLSMLWLGEPRKYNPDFDSSLIRPRDVRKEIRISEADAVKYTDADMKYYWEILDNLSAIYYESHNPRMEVGFILANISKKSNQMYDLWIKFYKKSNDFDQTKADRLWDSAKMGFWSEQHLLDRLLLSSPEKYKTILNMNLIKKIRNHKEMWYEDDVAELAYDLGKYKYKMCSIKKNDQTIYEFVDHVWKKRINSVSFHNFLKQDVKKVLIEAKDALNRDLSEAQKDESENSQEKNLSKLYVSLCKTICQLRQDKFKKNVVSCAFDYFNDYDFLENIDKKYNKLAFKNGVMCYSTGIFSAGDPSDNITQQIPFDYYPYDPDAPYHKYFLAIDKFYEDLYPDPEQRRYVKHIDAKCCKATTDDVRTLFNYGHGQNGKTKKSILFQMGFGEYYCELDVGVCTQQTRKKSNEANSEKSKLRHKYVVYTSEIGQNEQLSMAIVKELTGCGQITGARDIFERAADGTFKGTARIYWQVNYLPKIDCDIDEGVSRRIRIIKYEVQFVPPNDIRIKENPKKYKPIDPDIDRKIEVWAKYFASYLTHIYLTEILGKPEPEEPEVVMGPTKRYFESVNILESFKNKKIERKPDEIISSILTRQEAWEAFQKWKVEENLDEKITQSAFNKYMEARFESYVVPQGFDGIILKQ